jgi:hypothetical protein
MLLSMIKMLITLYIRRYIGVRKCYRILYVFISSTLLLSLFGSIILDNYDPCLAPETTRNKLIYMIRSFTEIMTELNVTHWVDYGTLLGAIRYENIIVWDYDADVSFDRKFAYLLHQGGKAHKIAKERYNLFLNAAVMLYEGMQTDIYSWRKQRVSDGNYIYVKAANRGIDLLESQFNDFNASFLEKTVLIPFAGGFVKAPYPRVLREHFFSVPVSRSRSRRKNFRSRSRVPVPEEEVSVPVPVFPFLKSLRESRSRIPVPVSLSKSILMFIFFACENYH